MKNSYHRDDSIDKRSSGTRVAFNGSHLSHEAWHHSLRGIPAIADDVTSWNQVVRSCHSSFAGHSLPMSWVVGSLLLRAVVFCSSFLNSDSMDRMELTIVQM